jgi:hypothetical protein
MNARNYCYFCHYFSYFFRLFRCFFFVREANASSLDNFHDGYFRRYRFTLRLFRLVSLRLRSGYPSKESRRRRKEEEDLPR